ncbi:unnamed protein product [Heligmosomoides polygyrus]|uniref:Uncharacterized protein n=1 Tax=Heligmosomoides polygyrus TaxID=6339 RepID=A0A183GMT0_HELPZ|nr:unnamed protein product [Heligmosomoides polygyrus]
MCRTFRATSVEIQKVSHQCRVAYIMIPKKCRGHRARGMGKSEAPQGCRVNIVPIVIQKSCRRRRVPSD